MSHGPTVEAKNQQDRFLGVDREWGDDPEGRVKVEGASQEYEFSSEESEGEENNREAKHDPPDSRSPEGRVKGEGESRGYEFSSEESEGIRGWLKSRELPLWSLKPPYFPKMLLVSPLLATPTLGTPS
jgi:hypothetical protein